jgi:hypothetical protein
MEFWNRLDDLIASRTTLPTILRLYIRWITATWGAHLAEMEMKSMFGEPLLQ